MSHASNLDSLRASAMAISSGRPGVGTTWTMGSTLVNRAAGITSRTAWMAATAHLASCTFNSSPRFRANGLMHPAVPPAHATQEISFTGVNQYGAEEWRLNHSALARTNSVNRGTNSA